MPVDAAHEETSPPAPSASEPTTDDRQTTRTADAEEPLATSGGDSIGGEALRILESQIDALREDFGRRAMEYEGTIRTLQATVEELRAQQLLGMMKPTLQQFADLKAEIDAAASRARERAEDHHAEEYEFFSGSVDAILDNFDLESVRATVGDPFDRRAHAAVLRKPTDDPGQDLTIARVARQGFRVIGETRVLIPARVVVWSYTPPPDESPTAAPGADGDSG